LIHSCGALAATLPRDAIRARAREASHPSIIWNIAIARSSARPDIEFRKRTFAMTRCDLTLNSHLTSRSARLAHSDREISRKRPIRNPNPGKHLTAGRRPTIRTHSRTRPRAAPLFSFSAF